MFNDYLALDGTEVLNAARAAAYIKAFLPKVTVWCGWEALPAALNHSAYQSPFLDGAPWTRSGRAAAERFYGLMPKTIKGADNSTREVQNTELTGHGSVQTSPRYKSREIRVTATAFAADEEAMMEGLAWLRQVCAHEGCSDAAPGCTGITASMFAAPPVDAISAYDLARTFHRVEVTEGPLVTNRLRTASGCKWEIEFTMTAGIPWAFTSLANAGTLDLGRGVNFQDPAGENCAAGVNAYDDFVADPFFTGISRPPRPPVILPPNILKITSWRRSTLGIPVTQTSRFGRTVPVMQVTTTTAMQYLRLRFYRDGASGCGFDADMIVSYLPAAAVLTLDGRTRTASLRLSTGHVVPAGHLLFGSDGRPFTWPSLGCQTRFTLAADLMPGQSGVGLLLQTAVRD